MANPPTVTAMTQRGSFPRDDNGVPITGAGLITSTSKTLSGNNTTVATPIFTIAGLVEITGLYAVVTTALGTNCTAAYWRTNDGATQSNITLNTGTDISNAVAGSLIYKGREAAVALVLVNATSFKIGGNSSAALPFQPFLGIPNVAATSNIEFVYSTTDTPTVGALTFYVRWFPIGGTTTGTLGGSVTAL